LLRAPLRAQFDAVDGGWARLLQDFADSEPGRALCAAVDARLAAGVRVYPGQVFRALQLTPPERVRVLILGQDPYHGPDQAEGLAFSVAPGQRWPPSLRNLLQEWQRDLGHGPPASGSLQAWAEQGVLLLNSALTVEDGLPGSHAKLGWQALTEKIVTHLLDSNQPKVFLLWGAHAQAWAPAAREPGCHLVLCCNHPSPLSARRGPAPFLGCGHFGQAQRFLQATGCGRLDWFLR
jgi:uracil-DNA glycosylase